MDLTVVLFLVSVFLFAAMVVEMAYLSWSRSRFKERWAVKKRLLYITAGGRHGKEKLALYKSRILKDVSPLEKFAYSLPRVKTLDRMLLRAGIAMNASSFLLTSLALGGMGFLAAARLLPHWTAALLPGLGFLLLPFFYLRLQEKSTLRKFEEQLPEGLDLLSRSLRSGLALSAGLEILVQEMGEPMKSEFSAAVDEINLGLSFKEALENMCDRVPSRDLRFFAVATLIQRDTGGNLAEILEQISILIRDRMKFKRQVKALTAEGRLSGVILIALPIVMFFYLYFVNYDYLSLLWRDPIGYLMVGAAILNMFIGAFVINRIVKVEM